MKLFGLKANKIENLIKINNKARVAVPSNPLDYYDSRIEDISKKDIGISMPTKGGRVLPLRTNSLVNVSVLTNKGSIVFVSHITGILRENIDIITIKTPTKFRLEASRQFFRVPVHLKIEARICTYTGQFTGEEVPCVLTELSGGGCVLRVTRGELHVGDKLRLDFINTPVGIGMLDAKIIRNVGRKNIFSAEFTDINESDRDKVVRYIFRRQLELRNVR